MKITLKLTIVAIIAITAIAVFGAGFVLAQGQTPWGGYGMMNDAAYQNGTPVPGFGYGARNGQGMMGNGFGMTLAPARSAGVNGVNMNGMHQWMSTTGSMHTLIWNDLAEALDLTPDELNAELASGKTLTQIAAAQDVTPEQLAAALETSVKAGLDRAVTDGTLTQAQADRMFSQMGGRFEWMLNQMGAGGIRFGSVGCHGNIVPPTNP